MSDYPEHAKLGAIADRSQAIGEFLDWLEDHKGVSLVVLGDGLADWEFFRTGPGHLTVLAEFFKIDLDKIEAEKRAMLATLAASNQTKET